MSEDRRHVQHYHTTNPNATPSPEALYDGEIALNIAADNEKIYVKNTDGEIVTFRDDKYYQEVISGAVSTKQDTITDLATIRANAALGATALQTETYKGTVTGVKINGTTKTPTNGTVDLGTVITDHQDISGKVDKETGKGLSTNDYTTTEKNKLAGIATGAEVNVQSDWNVTDTSSDAYIKNKPTIPSAVTEATVSGWGFTKNSGTYSKPSGGIPKTDLASAVQTSLGKADTALQSIPDEYITETELNAKNYATTSALNNKVDKVSGKQLSTEDFTTTLKTKLESVNAKLQDTNDVLDDVETNTYVKYVAQTLTEEQKAQARKNIGVEGTGSNVDLSEYATKTELNAKQDVINDLATIRSGAALGATALQSYSETYKGSITGVTAGSGLTGGGTKTNGATGVTLNVGAGTGITVTADAVSVSADYQNKITSGTTAYGWGNHANAGYATNSALTSHTSSSATTSSLGHVTLVSGDVKSVTYANGKAAAASHTHSQYLTGYTEQYKGTVTGVTINGSTKSPSNGNVNLGTVITSHQDISGKQDKLTSGTNIKTINNTSVLGSGNIAVQPTLVSGTNIKTINGTSILGSGNITIEGGGSSLSGGNVQAVKRDDGELDERPIRDARDLTTGELVYFTGDARYITAGGGMLLDYIDDGDAQGRIYHWNVEAIETSDEEIPEEVMNIIFSEQGLVLLNGGVANLDFDNGLIYSSIINDGIVTVTKVYTDFAFYQSVVINEYNLNSSGSSSGSVTSIKIDNVSKSPSSGVVDLGYVHKQLSASTSSSMTLSPNVYYRNTSTSLASLTITFGSVSNSNIMNEYFVEFTTRSSGTTVSFPSSVKWADGVTPTWEAGCTYQVSVINNLGVVTKFK